MCKARKVQSASYYSTFFSVFSFREGVSQGRKKKTICLSESGKWNYHAMRVNEPKVSKMKTIKNPSSAKQKSDNNNNKNNKS